jgi:hypothetical protein
MSRLVARLGARRGRLTLLLVAIGMLFAFVAGPARALPPRCPDGSPPPCEGEDPPPTTEPRPRPTTTTTRTTPPTAPIPPPPPTTNPPPPPATWKVNVLELEQDDGGLTGVINAERYFMYEPVLDPGPYLFGPGPETTIGMTPAGTSGLDNGQFSFPDYPLPTGQKVVLKVTEGGSPGVLCRTVPRGALPLSGVPLHILVAPPVTMAAAELQGMVAGFVGPVTSGLPDGVTMTIASAGLTPQADGLMLRLQGTLAVGAFNYSFDYHLLLTLVPSTGTDLAYVLYIQPVGPGTVDLTSVGEPNGDGLIEAIKAQLLPKLRSAVPVRGTPAVNDKVHLDDDVQWWRDEGFNISMRRVTYSATGMTLYPSLCRLGY